MGYGIWEVGARGELRDVVVRYGDWRLGIGELGMGMIGVGWRCWRRKKKEEEGERKGKRGGEGLQVK